jgi:branched-chain amino acid transport system substrate-binding protein
MKSRGQRPNGRLFRKMLVGAGSRAPMRSGNWEEPMKTQLRYVTLTAAAGFAAALATWSAMAAEAPTSIRIGYAISLSGVNAQGVAVTTLPGYKLWVHDVNENGGIIVKEFGKRIPIEVIEYDDTSDAETVVRLTEKLMSQDKVDFALPPWSTGFNLAVAPVYARFGYPQLAVAALTNNEADLVKQMPTLFFFLDQPANFGHALVEVLNQLKSENKINNKIVLLSVGDQFGAEASRLRDHGAEELSARRRRSYQRN